MAGVDPAKMNSTLVCFKCTAPGRSLVQH